MLFTCVRVLFAVRYCADPGCPGGRCEAVCLYVWTPRLTPHNYVCAGPLTHTSVPAHVLWMSVHMRAYMDVCVSCLAVMRVCLDVGVLPG